MTFPRWAGRDCDQPQVGNAKCDVIDLTPASEAPAVQVRAAWAAVLPDPDLPPLIWEK